jgi:hypothetical protein
MKRLILSMFAVACLASVAYGQSPYRGCGCQQPRRQVMAMASIPTAEEAAEAAAAAYRAWNSPEARIARQAAGAQWRNGQRMRQIREDALRMQAARAELAWKLRMGYTPTNRVPTANQWIYNGVNRPAKSDKWERSPASDSRMYNPAPVAGRGWDLVAPRSGPSDRRIYDPHPISGGSTVPTFTTAPRQYRDTFTPSNNAGGRSDRGGRDSTPSRDTSPKESRSYRDDLYDRDRGRP